MEKPTKQRREAPRNTVWARQRIEPRGESSTNYCMGTQFEAMLQRIPVDESLVDSCNADFVKESGHHKCEEQAELTTWHPRTQIIVYMAY